MKKSILFKVQLVYVISFILVCAKPNQQRLLYNFGVANNQQRRVLQGDILNVCNKDGLENCEIQNENCCLKCQDNFAFPSCQECISGHYKSNNKCLKCTDDCLICSTIDKCSKCKLNFTLTDGKCTCTGNIIDGNYILRNKKDTNLNIIDKGRCLGNSKDKNYYFAEYDTNKNYISLYFSEEIEIKNEQSDFSVSNCDTNLINYYQNIECKLLKAGTGESFTFVIKLLNDKTIIKKDDVSKVNLINNIINKNKLQFELLIYQFISNTNKIDNLTNQINKYLKIEDHNIKIDNSLVEVLFVKNYQYDPDNIIVSIIHNDKKINYEYHTNYQNKGFLFPRMENYCNKFQIQIEQNLTDKIKTTDIVDITCDYTNIKLILSDDSIQQFQKYDFYDPITVEFDEKDYFHSQTKKLQYSVILNINNKQEIFALNNDLKYNVSKKLENIDLTQTLEIETNFQAYDPILKSKFQIQKPIVYKPKTYFEGCLIEIEGFQNQGFVFNNIVTIKILNCITTGMQNEFFYYESEEDKSIEKNNPQINRKKMLASLSQNQQVQSVFLTGSPIICGVIQNPKLKNYQLTKNITFKQADYSENQFEQFIQIVYNMSQNQQTLGQKLLIINKIIQEAQQYMKQQDITEISNKNINNYIYDIFQSLSFYLLNQKSQDFQTELLKMISSLVKIFSKSFMNEINTKKEENLKTSLLDLEKNIQNLNESTKSEYKTYQSSLITEYMNNLYILNEFDISSSLKYIELNMNALKGISKTTKESLMIKTQTAKLQIDKLNYQDLMAKYFVTSNSNTNQQQLGQTHTVLLQIWPEQFPLFRDEIINYLKDLEKKLNQSQGSKNISLKQYPLISGDIFSEDSLQNLTPEIISSSPIQIKFGPSLKSRFMQSQSNKLQELEQERLCIQRQNNGYWTSDHCKYKTKLIQNQVEMVCECSKIGITTIIDDIKDLFDNENLDDILNKDGLFRIFSLDNWYEYALIWTVFGLNIFLIISILFGVKMDKHDKQSEFQVKETTLKRWKLNEIAQEDIAQEEIAQEDIKQINDQLKKSLFISIKNTQVSRFSKIYQSSKELDKQKSQKPKQTNKVQKQNTLIEIDLNKHNQNLINKKDQQISNDFIKKGTCQKDNLIVHESNNTPLITENDNQSIKDKQTQFNKQQNDVEKNLFSIDTIQNGGKLNKYHTQSENVLLTLNDVQFEEIQHTEILNEEQNLNDKQETLNQLNTYANLATLNQLNTNNEIIKSEELEKHTEVIKNEIKEKKTEIKTVSQIDNSKTKPQIETKSLIETKPLIDTKSQIETKSLIETNTISSKQGLNQDNKKQKKEDKEQKKLSKQQKLMNVKQKMATYLELESKCKAILLFHNLFSIFLLSMRQLSRAIRFIIYYYKLIWLLAITSIFGQNLNITQVITLSITSWVILYIFTKIVKLLFLKKKLRVFCFLLTFIFLVLCYYCIFSIMSKQNYKAANNWIGTYMLTFLINELIIDTIKSAIYYYIFRKFLKHMNHNIFIKILSQIFLFKSFLK